MKVIHCAISTFLIDVKGFTNAAGAGMRRSGKQAGLKKKDASTGAVTLIQRFGSAANLNIHLHCLFLDGVYRKVAGKPLLQVVPPPSEEQLQKLLHRIMQRLMQM